MRWFVGASIAGVLAWIAWPWVEPVRVEVVLASETDRVEIRWRRGRAFENDRAVFTAPVAGARLTTGIPADTRSLRLVLRSTPGTASVESITVRGLTTHARWDASNRFRGWLTAQHLGQVRHGDTLALDATSPGAFVVCHTVRDAIASGRLRERACIALVAALIGALLAGRALRRRPVVARRLALATATTGVAAALAWGAWSLVGPPAEQGYFDRGDAYVFTFVDEQGRRLSEQNGRLRMLLDPWTHYRNAPGQRDDHFTIDENGFRDGVTDGDAPLVAVVGGSTAFGHGLAPGEQTFCRALESSTGQRLLNAGVSGFLSGQELATIVHRLDDWRPSVYVAFDGWNDFCEMAPLERPVATATAYRMFAERLRSHHLLLGGNPDEPPVPLEFPAPPPGDATVRSANAYADNLEKMHAWAVGRGARFLVAFQPVVGQKTRSAEEAAIAFSAERSAEYERFLGIAKKRCDAAAIRWIDVGADTRITNATETLFLDAVHLNAAGHARVAEILAPLVRGE